VLGGASVNTSQDRKNRRFPIPDFGGNASSQAKPEPPLYLDDCRSLSQSSRFAALAAETARRVGVEPRALAVRTLLQLPRIASYAGSMTKWQVQRELRIAAERLRRDVQVATRHVAVGRFALKDLSFEEIDASRALPVLTLLHYLRSARPGSRYFALLDPIQGLPVTVCSVSPLAWRCVATQIRRFDIDPERTWDLSRVFSIDNAPRNAISTLLSRVRLYLRQHMPDVELLVTAVDPNLGFTGCSYRASNWQQWMTVRARPYLYENGCYVSPRQLRERYGSSNLVDLRAQYPSRFERSRAPLLDSMIYCCKISGETQAVLDENMTRLRRRPERGGK
jgi:hypothetical protein